MFAHSKGIIIQNHCVILILHSDFPYSYTFSWVGAVQTTSPAPRRPRNNSVVTMIHCLPSANYRCVAKQHTYRAQAVCGHFRRFSEGKWRRKPRSRNCHLPTASIRALRMTMFFLAGASPLHPAKQVRTQLFDCFLCTLTYRFLE